MQEPAYVMKDGTTIPYVPVEVKTARDAYAASLHVLFKHVADFHLCVVRTFSVKYGIPEDDILKTIQESDEFKNMQVDPVLCMDMGINSLRHLDKAPVPDSKSEEVTTAPVTAPVKSKVKKTKKSEPEPKSEPPTPVSVATEESRPDADPQPELIKPKTIRKKIVVPKPTQPITEPVKVATEPVKVAPATIAPTAPLTEDAPRKIIKKNASK
jgi:hypothetical protein